VSHEIERARELIGLRRPKEAAAAALRHLTIEPESASAHMLLSLAKTLDGQHAAAIASAEAAVRHAPDLAHAHFVLAFAARAAGKTETAAAAVARCLELDPEKADAHDLLARLHLDRNETRAALDSSARAVALAPQDPDHHETMARALHSAKRPDEAHAAVTTGLQLAPNHTGLQRLAGVLHLEAGRAEAAAQAFLGTLRSSPDDAGAKIGLADALRARNRFYAATLVMRRGAFGWVRERNWLALAIWFALCVAAAVAMRSAVGVAALRGVVVVSMVLPTDMANVTLLLDPLGRHLLSRTQAACAVLVALLLAAAAVLAGLAATGLAPSAWEAAGACGAGALLTSVLRLALDHVTLTRAVKIGLAVLVAIAIVLALLVMIVTR